MPKHWWSINYWDVWPRGQTLSNCQNTMVPLALLAPRFLYILHVACWNARANLKYSTRNMQNFGPIRQPRPFSRLNGKNHRTFFSRGSTVLLTEKNDGNDRTFISLVRYSIRTHSAIKPGGSFAKPVVLPLPPFVRSPSLTHARKKNILP